jgi:hypothetical protein
MKKLILNTRLSHIAYLLLVAVLFSCDNNVNIEYEYKQQVVSAKRIDLADGSTRYNIAFTDGDSDDFSFGLYTKYQIGDTVFWKREKGDYFWYVDNCH